MKSWVLADGEERARASASFEIPARDERRSLVAGDVVKLVFELAEKPRFPPDGERMWLRVVGVASEVPRRYVGELENRPVVVRDLREGDLVEFGPEHVVGVVGLVR